MRSRWAPVRWFNDLSMAKKLYACFALLIAGLVVVVIAGSSGMSSMSAAHHDVVRMSTDATDKPLVAAIETATARFDRGDAALWALVRSHRTDGALKLVEGAQNDAADALMAAFAAYQRSSATDVKSQTAGFDASASSARQTMIRRHREW